MRADPDLTAVALIEAYRNGSLTPPAIMEAVLARVATREPELCALWALEAGAAMAEAERSAERWRRGTPMGPLDGVPVTVKENIATRGVPIPLGTAATELVPATADAPPAARLREAGAILFAKTTMPDYGMLSSGLSSFHALARNPWDISRNPGGSSAGAATAAAAGYGPLHLGTDIGGSVRLPAGWCGLVGLKPSHGRVPVDPAYLGRVAGPMTRTVADAALMMRVLCAPDWRDPTSLPPQAIDWSNLEQDLRGQRIGLMLEIGAGMEPDGATLDAVAAAAALFASAGAVVETVPALLTRAMLDGIDDFWRVWAWDDLSRLPEERRARVLPYIRAWAKSGAQRSGLDVMRGYNRTMEMRNAAASLFRDHDFILSPTAPCLAFAAGSASPLDDPERPFEHIGYTVAWNMAENPAISVNCGYAAGGLPIGLQIVGRRFDDPGVLRLARFVERYGPAQRPWPTEPR